VDSRDDGKASAEYAWYYRSSFLPAFASELQRAGRSSSRIKNCDT
jgi:hypothetical protein